MTERNIPIAVPSVGDEEWEATRDCFQSGWLTSGPKVHAFEEAFAKRHGCAHGIAVTSGTSGLHLSLVALGIGPGDEVLVPAFTWVATANTVVQCGAKPVFVDVERHSFNIDSTLVASKVSDRTKAIIPVHLFGLCADIDSLKQELPESVAIIEDAACAAGAFYKGQSAGSLGDLGVFSFHPRKTITTGEGGMISTNDATLAEKLQRLKNHGAVTSDTQRLEGPKPYLLADYPTLGFNYRMTDIQAAIGLVQLEKLSAMLEERRLWAAYYNEAFSDLPWLITPQEPTGGLHGWQSYVCYVDPDRAPCPRNKLMDQLRSVGISTRPGTHAVHQLGYYQDTWGWRSEDCPVASACDRHSLALPLHNKMEEADYYFVIDQIHAIAKEAEAVGV